MDERGGDAMAKYKSGNYLQKSRAIYQGNPSIFQQLSPPAVKLFEWLHECEHRFTGKNEDWFFRSNQQLAQDTNMSLRIINRAKKELRQKGLIETCNMHWIDRTTGKKSQKHITAYRILR